MNTEIKALHFTLDEEQKDYIQKKIERIRNAENMIVDFRVTMSKEAAEYSAESTLNFKWGVQAHVKESAYDVLQAVDKMLDSLRTKITKEKEKLEQRSRL
ncbi:MAG: ribosome-associated translation inhibitor RaiA [Spirochaetaceae bacterium]|jgi:putative sigma-54 modulation protein|nr:ribosome-associated translation inhibitor RaiA [Spirochaetaceae bacterium]